MKEGSPPRMRGKARARSSGSPRPRITPACAGKSVRFLRNGACQLGSPPHVRGKGAGGSKPPLSDGITPACAGKSGTGDSLTLTLQDHPRMCGEKLRPAAGAARQLGSPPHVRGKVDDVHAEGAGQGITPACAGKRLKRSRSTVPPVAIVPLFPSVCNKPVVSDGSPAGRDAPLFLPAENAVPASPAYNLRSL